MFDTLSFIKAFSNSLVRGCTKKTPGGVTLFTPDGVASYDALWLRDFSYMAEYDPDSVTAEELEGCIRFAVAGAREDGWMPDRVYADGLAVYAAGEVGKPVGKANLDNTPFLVYMVSDLLARLSDDASSPLFREWYPAMEKGMKVIPLSQSGLVYSDPACPHSPYGFTDTVAKGGELMIESLLFWRACRKLADMCRRFGAGNPAFWDEASGRVEAAMPSLYDFGSGMFFAASEVCRQIDIWGSAYMLYIGFPAGEKEQTVLNWLKSHTDDYIYEGQIRHLPKGEYWEKLLIGIDHETYQNGACWATATGWLAWCLFRADRDTGLKVLADCIRYFRDQGSFECVNPGYQKLGSFVVSATNVLGGLKRIIAEDPSAEADLNRMLDR